MLLAIAVGILNDWLEIAEKDSIPLIMIYVLSALFLANYYRVKKITSVRREKAIWLSVFVPGVGQIYAQQKPLGISLVMIHFIAYFYGITGDEKENKSPS